MADFIEIVAPQLIQTVTTIISVIIVSFAAVYLLKYFFEKIIAVFFKALEKWERISIENKALDRTMEIRGKYRLDAEKEVENDI